MAILQATNSTVGLVGVVPSMVFINTNDSLATVTTTGYLTQAVNEGLISVSNKPSPLGSNSSATMALVNTTGGASWLTVSITGTAPNLVYSLIEPPQGGGAIFLGDVQAGANGTAGRFLSYPATINTGHLVLAGASNAGNTVNTITNASQAGARTFTIPDPGVASTTFLLADNAATQTIATGSLALTVGTLTLGSSNHASNLTVYPPTAANGFMKILPIAAGGAFNTIISNSAMGQTTTFSIPDPGNAAGQFLVGASATPFNSGNFPIASGTAGLMADSGININSLNSLSVTVTMNTAAVVGAYATPVEILPAPGANKSYLITAAYTVVTSTGNTAFSSGGVGVIQYGTTVHGGGTLAVDADTPSADITAAASQCYIQYGLATTTALTGAANEPIYWTNKTMAFAGGTGTNVILTLQYVIVTGVY